MGSTKHKPAIDNLIIIQWSKPLLQQEECDGEF